MSDLVIGVVSVASFLFLGIVLLEIALRVRQLFLYRRELKKFKAFVAMVRRDFEQEEREEDEISKSKNVIDARSKFH